MRTLQRRQRGMTLFVALVMLVLMMLLAASAFNLSRTNTGITANMQNKIETTNAAMQAVEQTITTDQFINTPANALANSCGTNQACFDVNQDGKDDITVVLNPPPCIKKIQVIKNASLNMNNAQDIPCALGASQNLGVAGASTGDSLCAESVWEITARASDAVTQAQSTVVTGVGVRVAADEALDASKACP